MQDYHDDEWGVPVVGEAALFERLTLEAFQSGLSWSTILNKRPAFRAAFDGFDADRIATYDDSDVARLMADAGIVRNRMKIDATLVNARAVIALREDGGLEEHVHRFAPERQPEPETIDQVPAKSAGVAGALQAPEEARLHLRRPDHDARPDGGHRDRQHPPPGLPPPHVGG